MAVIVTEHPESRGIQIGNPDSTHRRIYTIYDSGGAVLSHGEVIEALANFAPGLADIWEGGANEGFFFLPRVKVDAIPAPKGGPRIWQGFADYDSYGPDEFGFDAGGNTEHITHNDRGPTFSYGPGGVGQAPPMYGFIGVNGDSIEGVDLPPGSIANQMYRKKLRLGKLTSTYIETVKSHIWSVNEASFYGAAAGEALLLSGSGRNLPDNTNEVMFRWAVKPRREDVWIGGNLFQIPVIEGWDYLWVLSEDHGDGIPLSGTVTQMVKRPVAAYVERLFPWLNWAGLDIGTVLP